jgi:N-acetylmuramoyl-L-alanine amidase
MLDPLGDAHHIGRTIKDSFERSIMYQLAQKLKQTIEEKRPDITVMISRSLHDANTFLQSAQSANRLGVNLYLSLGCYYTSEQPAITLFHTKTGNDSSITLGTLAFIPYNQAHRINLSTSSIIAETLHHSLEQSGLSFVIAGPYAIPCRLLTGVIAPSIYIEFGFTQKNDWVLCIDTLTNALVQIDIQQPK